MEAAFPKIDYLGIYIQSDVFKPNVYSLIHFELYVVMESFMVSFMVIYGILLTDSREQS